MALSVTKTTPCRVASEKMFIHGDEFDSTCEVWIPTSLPNETITSHSADNITVFDEARRREQVKYVISNGYSLPAWGSNAGKLLIQSHQMSIHDSQTISLAAQQYVPLWVTKASRTIFSNTFVANNPEIWGVEAHVRPEFNSVQPGEDFLVYGINLTSTMSPTTPPITWLYSSNDPTSLFEIETISLNRTNTGGYQADNAFTARARAKVSRAVLTTPNQINANCTVGFVSTSTGATTNNHRVAFVSGGSLSVAVASNGSGSDVTVTFVNGVTTANDVIALVNGDASARAVVRAFKGYLGDGTGVVSAFVATNLTGGRDAGNVSNGKYRIATQSGFSHYGVGLFYLNGVTQEFNISNALFPTGFTVDATGPFTYNAVSYELRETDPPETQSIALYAACARAAQLHNTDKSKRAIIKLKSGTYRITRPVIVPHHCCLCVVNGGTASFEADPDNDFQVINRGGGYPASPGSYYPDITFADPRNPSVFSLLPGAELRDVKIIVTRQHYPIKFIASHAITFMTGFVNETAKGYLVEDVEIIDRSLHAQSVKPAGWGDYRPAAIMQEQNATNIRINRVRATCQLFSDIVSGDCRFGSMDNIFTASPATTPDFGGVGRVAKGSWIVRNFYWDRYFRGITDSGNLSIRKSRNFYMNFGPVGMTGYNADGSEQFLVEGGGVPMNDCTFPNSTTIVGRHRFASNLTDEVRPPVADTFYAHVVSGPGKGQIRKITAVSGGFSQGDPSVKYTLTLDSPWISQPTSESVISVGHVSNENIAIGYRSGFAMRGIGLYDGCFNWHIVDCVFNNVDCAIWVNARRDNNINGNFCDRLSAVAHIFLYRNSFINCSDAMQFSVLDYGETGIASGPLLPNYAVGHHMTFTRNRFVNCGLNFMSSAFGADEPDFTSLAFNRNSFDTGFLPAYGELGNVAAAEFSYPKPRQFPFIPIAIGNTGKAWPVREYGNIICNQLVTSLNDIGSPLPPDGQKVRMVGGSENLWGPQTFVNDMRGPVSNRSYLAKPTGFAYNEGLDGTIALGGFMRAGNSISNAPLITKVRSTVEEYVVSITADISGIKAKTDKLQFDVSNNVLASAGADLSTLQTAIAAVDTKVTTANTSLSSITTTLGTVNTNVSSVNTKTDTLTTNLATANTNVSAIKTKTDQLVFISGDVRATIDNEYTQINANFSVNNLVLTGYSTVLTSIDTKVTNVQTAADAVNAKIGAATDVLPTNNTVWAKLNRTDTNASSAATSSGTAATNSDAIKTKTDQISFISGDVRATIDNEFTTIDTATSSLASTLATLNSTTGTVNTNVAAIKSKTDGLTVTGGNVRAKLSSDGLADVDVVETSGVFTKLQAGLGWLLARFANSSELDRSSKTLTVRDKNGNIMTVQNFNTTETTDTVDRIEG